MGEFSSPGQLYVLTGGVSTVFPVFFGQDPPLSLHSLALFPPLSLTLISYLAFVDVKQHGQVRITCKHSESA